MVASGRGRARIPSRPSSPRVCPLSHGVRPREREGQMEVLEVRPPRVPRPFGSGVRSGPAPLSATALQSLAGFVSLGLCLLTATG